MSANIQRECPWDAARRLATLPRLRGYRLTALHEYQNADGSIWCWRIRCDHSTKDKWMRPMHWKGTGYELVEPPAPQGGKPIYRLPELLAADPNAIVWIVEGEKCADVLAKLGLIVTTSGSCSSADAADWTPLRGRSVRVWPDNDRAGAKYADAAMAKLRTVGVKCNIVDIAALGLPDKDDCVDWLAMNPNATAVDVLALGTVPQTAKSKAEPDGVELIDAASLKPEPVRWIWPGWLARGKLHVLAGAPGTGKTTLAIDWAACVSAGRVLPSGYRPKRGNVLIWSGEDDPADTLIPRLIAAGADLSRIRFVGEVTEDGKRYPFDPARDVPKLAAAVAGMDSLVLLIVDPLVSAVSGDSHKNAEVRRGLAPLVDFAAANDAALLGITHYSKGTQGREPLERVSGSLAFGALARVVLGTVRMKTKGDEANRKMMLARCKSNIGPDGGGFSYAFEQVELAAHGGLAASRIVWGTAVEGTARELLAEVEQEGTDTDSRDAADWLRVLLADGPIAVKDVRRHSNDAGHAWRTVQRAMRAAGVESKRGGFGLPATWALAGRATVAPVAPQKKVGANGANEEVLAQLDGNLVPLGSVEVLDL